MDTMESLRTEFPIASRYAYLNNAATAPVSKRVSRAVSRFYRERMNLAEGAWDRWVKATTDVRRLAARLLNVSSEEIAILKNTSEGLNIVASGLRLRPGQRVVTTDFEFPSNLYPWLKLKERGVDVRIVPHQPDGTTDVDEIRRELGPRGGLVAISHVQYGNGFKIDLAALRESVGDECMLCVDGIQSLGVTPVDARALNFLSSGGHKWLLAPFGAAIFYVRRDSDLDPPFVGWASVEEPEAYLPQMHLSQTATRFEIGNQDFSSIYGLREALGLILEVGVERIERRTRRLVRLLEAGVKRMKLNTQTPPEEEKRGSILNIRVKGASKVVRALADDGIMVAERMGGVRVSPHFYNNEDDVERFLLALRRVST